MVVGMVVNYVAPRDFSEDEGGCVTKAECTLPVENRAEKLLPWPGGGA